MVFEFEWADGYKVECQHGETQSIGSWPGRHVVLCSAGRSRSNPYSALRGFDNNEVSSKESRDLVVLVVG